MNKTVKYLINISLFFSVTAILFSNCGQPMTALNSTSRSDDIVNSGDDSVSAKAGSCVFTQKNPYIISKDTPLQFEVRLKDMKGFQYSCDNQITWQKLDEEVLPGRIYSYFLPEGDYSCQARSQRIDNDVWELCSGNFNVKITGSNPIVPGPIVAPGEGSSASNSVGITQGLFTHSTANYGSYSLMRDSLVGVEEWKKFSWKAGQESQKTATVLSLSSPCIQGDLSCSLRNFPKEWGRNLNSGKGFVLRVLVPPGAESVSLSFSTPNTFSRGQYGWLNVDEVRLANVLECQMNNAEDPAAACAHYVPSSEYQSSAATGFFSTFSGAEFIIRAKSESSKAQYKYFVLFVNSRVTGNKQDNPLVFYGATISAHLSDRTKFDQWRLECASQGQDCLDRAW